MKSFKQVLEAAKYCDCCDRPMKDCVCDEKMDEAKDTVTKDAQGNVKSWSHEGDWKKAEKKDPVGKIHNMSDKARRQTEKMTKEEAEIEEGFENLPGKATHILNKDIRHPEHGIVSGSTVLRKVKNDSYEIRAGRAKGKIFNIDKQHVNKLQEETMSEFNPMSGYMSQIAKDVGAVDLQEKTLTPAELKKREEVAKAIQRENPGMDKSKKMAIATATAKKVAEDTENMHYCAKHVFSERFGEGMVVEGSHAEPDAQGLIEWYDVDFGGTVRRVMTEKVKVMHAEYHMNHKKKMKEEDNSEGDTPDNAKEKSLAKLAKPFDKVTHADVLTGRGVKKESLGEAMISYSDFKDKLDMHRKAGNKVVDDKYSNNKATYTTIDKDNMGRKVTHTASGTKMETLGKMGKQDDDENDDTDVKQTEKRGRGRPAGSKSGARRHN